MLKIAMIAGEASGDKLGAAMIDGFDALLDQPADFIGVGGPLMIERGMDSLFDMSELSVMGIVEILKQYGHLKRRLNQCADYILAQKPDVLITIDAPEFSLRLAEIIKSKSDIPTVHYVAPTVWAWRPKRAEKMAKYIDHVLALFPFEPPYMHEAEMSCDFVGHPVTHEPLASDQDIADFRSYYDLGDTPVALVLPGSRTSEVKRLLPVFRKAMVQTCQSHRDLQWVLPTTAHVAGLVHEMTARWEQKPIVIDPRDVDADFARRMKRAAFRTADIALAASGTVSLELAANSTPMVIAYNMGWLSRQIIGRMLLTDTVTLVNLVSGDRSVPEFIGQNCRPDYIADALSKVLQKSTDQDIAMDKTMQALGRDGIDPGQRAAKSVLDFLGP